MTIEQAAAKLTALYEGFRELEYADIEPAVTAVLGGMKAADAVAAYTRFAGIGLAHRWLGAGRRGAIRHVVLRIEQRKESFERCNFR
jgi:hypothetical protein